MMNKAIILSLAATAMAAPRYHPSGSGVPYPAGNSTGIWGTGTGTGKACSLVSKTPGAPTTTSTSVVYETTDVTSVLTVTGVKAQGTGAPGAGAGGNGGVCSSRSTVTVKTTEKVYVTVTPGFTPPASAATSNAPVASSPSAPVAAEKPSSSVSFVLASPSAAAAPSPSAAAQQPSSAPVNTPSAAQPSQYQAPSAAAPVSSVAAPAPSSYVAPVPVPVPSTKPSSSAAAPVSSTPATGGNGSYGSGKRGLAYNDASLTQCFAGDKSKVTWGYNWGSSRSGLPDNFDYVPMLWSTRSDFTSVWEKNSADAIAKGCTNILGFNEPDHAEQANMSPAAAVAGWKQYLEPVKAKNSQVRLGSPAVTNGGNGMGLDWLSSFLSQCSGCNIDFVAIHWYDSAKNVEYFKKHVQDAHDKSGGKPVWLTEFGATGSDSDISSFLSEVLPWLDSQSYVERYAYFMVKDGFLNAGTEKSAIGTAYATA